MSYKVNLISSVIPYQSVHGGWAKWDPDLANCLKFNLSVHPVTHILMLGQSFSVFLNWRGASSFLIEKLQFFL